MISIIIPTRGRARQLEMTLRGLDTQDATFEVIVVCDGPDEETTGLAARYQSLYPLRFSFLDQHSGIARARNVGASLARADRILFLDDDMSVGPGWVASHLERLDAFRGAVVGRIAEDYQQPARCARESYLRRRRQEILASFEETLQSGSRVAFNASFGVNCSIRKSEFCRAGRFDENLVEVNEDLALGARLAALGIRFAFEPDALVRHRNSGQRVDFHAAQSRAAMRAMVYRALQLGERGPQTDPLRAFLAGEHSVVQRLVARSPRAARALEGILSLSADQLSSQRLAQAWASTVYLRSLAEACREHEAALAEASLGTPRRPVLMFHSVSGAVSALDARHDLTVGRFSHMLDELRSAGWTPTNDPASLWEPKAKGSVVLTFDDGYRDFLEQVMPMLRDWGSAILFVVSGLMGRTNEWAHERGYTKRQLLSEAQVRDLAGMGVRIGSHTFSHAWLPDLDDASLRRELVDSKACLEDVTGTAIDCIAYPSGAVDDRVRSFAIEAGYSYGFTTRAGLNGWEDPMMINRVGFCEADSPLDLTAVLVAGRKPVTELRNGVRRRLSAVKSRVLRRSRAASTT